MDESLEEKNAITLLISGAYRAGANGNPNDKRMNAELSAIEKKVLKAAKAGDSAAASADAPALRSLRARPSPLGEEAWWHRPGPLRPPRWPARQRWPHASLAGRLVSPSPPSHPPRRRPVGCSSAAPESDMF